MYPVHDVDAILLLALSLAAKRRPAELVEIIAAADLAQGAIPSESKLSDSFYRLSEYGLICAQEGGYALRQSSPTPPDQPALLGGAQGKKSEMQNLKIGWAQVAHHAEVDRQYIQQKPCV